MILLWLLSLYCCCVSILATSDSGSASLNVVPYPSDVTLGSGVARIDPKFSINVDECTAQCDILQRSVDRYMGIIFQPVGSTGIVFRQTIFENRINATEPEGTSVTLRQLRVMITGKESAHLQLGVEESYCLEVHDQVTL